MHRSSVPSWVWSKLDRFAFCLFYPVFTIPTVSLQGDAVLFQLVYLRRGTRLGRGNDLDSLARRPYFIQ